MQDFVFIDQNGIGSGKAVSSKARKTIRTHVMREYRKKQLNVALDIGEPCDRGPPQWTQCFTLVQEGVSVVGAAERMEPNPSSRKRSVSRRNDHHVESPSRLLNRVVDTFVYAGSSLALNTRSYGLFSHYSSEFNIVLCDDIQPIPLHGTKNLCCSVTIQEDSAALLHAMCFTAAVHEAIVRHVVSDPRQILDSSLPDSNVQQDALRHKAESLQLVSKTLAQAPHAMAEGTILCVSVLRVGEAVFGDKAAIAAHTKGMSRMVEIFGGINLLSSSVVTQVYLSDIKAATVLRTRPSFLLSPLLDRQFGELSMTPLQPSSLSLSGIGARFFSNSIAIYICPELLKWCQYIRHLVNMTVCTQNPQAPSARLSIIDFIILEHHLLSLPHDQFLVGIEEAIRVALLLYSNIGLWHIPRYFAWVEILVSALQAALVSLDWACYSQQCPDLLFWLLMLGLHAAGRRTEVERKWFKESLEDIIKTIGLLKWQGARQILIEFLYVDSVFQKPYEKIWIDMALGSREDREMESMLGRHPCRYKYCQERS